jgi:hypothetical protein
MSQITIGCKLDEDNYQKGLGEIWVELDGEIFPERRWSDFVLIVLSEWNKTIYDLMSKKQKEGIIGFVDGTYAIRFKRVKNHEFEVTFGKWDIFDNLFYDLAEKKLHANIAKFANELFLNSQKIISN